MALTILDDIISSDRTAYSAYLLPGEARRWEVTWLSGRRLNRNAAITAMLLADVTSSADDIRPSHRLWVHVQSWAAELGLTAPDVLARTALVPARTDADTSATPSDPEAAA